MCPMPPLEVWIKVKNYYPIGTKIEREFNKDTGYIYDAIVTAFDLETNNMHWNGTRRMNIQKRKTTIPVVR